MVSGMSEQSQHPLQKTVRPEFELGARPLRVVDLFAGCGGLSLGLAQGAVQTGRSFEVALAVDNNPNVCSIYAENFPGAPVVASSVEDFFDGALGEEASEAERRIARNITNIDVLVGGPPCQGHSDLNNHSRRTDPRNHLYERMARAVEVLKPDRVLIENVPTVTRSAQQVVDRTESHLASLGYDVHHGVVSFDKLGVAQARKRHVLVATRGWSVSASSLFERMSCDESERRSVRWAIRDLMDVEPLAAIDTPSRVSADNLERMTWLLENDAYELPDFLRPSCHRDKAHTYRSVYGRLRWGDPAQTITTGFGSIGQGRFMHPERPRALTPHEAARLQGFPDYFSFARARTRRELALAIGNAVPPAMGRRFVVALYSLELSPGASTTELSLPLS